MKFFSGELLWAPLLGFILWHAHKQNSKPKFSLFVLFMLLALVASDVTSSYILKNIFTRLRPCRVEDLQPLIYQFGQKCGGRFGFVSSHAANTFALVIYSLSSLENKNKMWHLLWIMPIVVSFSRIYLGVHYPGDILGGMFVGLSWGAFMAWIFKNSKVQA
ncbi:MAG TPA: phosphatase PAP2 family protein [Bacteriovoracaceae bacterium]|nr:phosphatase PAP2 family protein [Bacteriovoracaceae bacterium]